jgi:DNA-binding response OmpR family regulator
MNENPTILAVDDTTESLTLLSSILTPAGYRVLAADSGELALAAISETLPDLILLDVRMKGMSGLELCRRLKASDETRSVPIIMISAFADVKEWVQGLQLGAADYITKPFQPEELLSRVKTNMALSRANVSLERQAAALHETNERLQSEIAERALAERALREKNEELLAALANVKTLNSLLPICAYCKKIRDGEGYWSQVEKYIQDHSTVTFSHGICPDCFKKLYPDTEEESAEAVANMKKTPGSIF